MAKKKNENEQPKAAEVEKGSVESQKTESEKTQENHHRVAVTTTEGNTIDKIRIFQEDNATKVQADYGKLKPDAETTEEKRAGMRTLLSRELSPEQAKEYQRLYADDPAKAKEYAVKSAYPMHVDDAKFHQKDTEINGRKVNYIVLEKRDAEKLNENSKHLAGQWQLSFGEKGNTDSRFFGLLNKEELASIRHRAEVTLDEHDQVKSVGKPLTMADIAAKVENRVVAQRLVNEKKLADAQKVDWSKFKLPSAANITGLHFSGVKDNPDRVWLKGKVNGIDVIGMLSKNETTAVRNKFATLEQALESWHADFGLVCDTPEGQALYYKERNTGNFVYTLGDKVAFLGKGRLNWKFGHQKKAGTHSVKFFIEPLTQSDYEIIPYSPNEQENETNIQTFLDKYEVKKYIRKTNDVGVKINFNKEFYIPEDIPSIDKVINGITKTLEEIQAINEEGIIKVAKRGLRENVEMKSSPIGNIPSHWEIRRTKDVCKSIFTGATPSTSVAEYWDGDIPWLPSGCCHDCYITQAPKYITKAGLENSSTRWIPKGTTVMAITGATCAQLGSLKIDACANQSVVAFIEDKTKINARYLFYILRALRGEILTNRTGGAQAGIDTGDCMNILICVPPIDEQEEIVAFLEEQCSQLDKKYQLIDRQMKQLQLLKRSIVSEIVTGKRKI